MTLSEILRRLDIFDEEATIIAEQPWAPSSRAQVIESADSGLVADYFIEVAVAREFKEDWSPKQGEDAFCKRLIQYAIKDA